MLASFKSIIGWFKLAAPVHSLLPASARDACISPCLSRAQRAERRPAPSRSITKFVGLVILVQCLVTYEDMPRLVKELMYGGYAFCMSLLVWALA